VTEGSSVPRLPISPRLPFARLGVAVVAELVELIVTGAVEPGQLLPPESSLAEQFGVSRTVIRESVKRLDEKGLVVVVQGRGTLVAPSEAWNMLDPTVLSALIDNDDSVGVLDELSVVRSFLEAAMAGQVAGQDSVQSLARLEDALAAMRENVHDETAFYQADVNFHFIIMELSGNKLAQNIAKSLYRRALESKRYVGVNLADAIQVTLAEHELIVSAVRAGDVPSAEASMREHIRKGWIRRRIPDEAAKPRGK